MGRASNRDTILARGLRVIRERGYLGSSVRDIAEAAGVPLGSFTNHFKSKEAFALEALNIYFRASSDVINSTLLNESLAPLKRVEAFLEKNDTNLNQNKEWWGCLIGNLSVEASGHSEVLRHRLEEISKEIEKSLASALKAAVKAGDLPKSTDCASMAGFIVFAQHGAYLQSKVDRDSKAIDRLKEIVSLYLLNSRSRSAA